MATFGRKFLKEMTSGNTDDFGRRYINNEIKTQEADAASIRMKKKELDKAATSEDRTSRDAAEAELARRAHNKEVKKELDSQLKSGDITEKQYKNRLAARTIKARTSENFESRVASAFDEVNYAKGGAVKKKTKAKAKPAAFSIGGYAKKYGKK